MRGVSFGMPVPPDHMSPREEGRRAHPALVIAAAALFVLASSCPGVTGAVTAIPSISGSGKNAAGSPVKAIEAQACCTVADGCTDVCEKTTTGADGTFSPGEATCAAGRRPPRAPPAAGAARRLTPAAGAARRLTPAA